jgi:hypothetical protein
MYFGKRVRIVGCLLGTVWLLRADGVIVDLLTVAAVVIVALLASALITSALIWAAIKLSQ